MAFENDYPDEKRVPNNQVIVCVTCAVSHATSTDLTEDVWNNCAWNATRSDEEDDAIEHARLNPHHILLRSFDLGYRMNGK